MRRTAPLAVAIVTALAAGGVAHAATNTYDVDARVSPSKAGTKKRPVPVGLRFSYRVGEVAGLRPAPVKRYRIHFDGLRVNPRGFRTCSAARINRAGNDRRCRRAARIGSGSVENVAGPTADPADRALACHLDLTIYNAGRGRAALYLVGSPSAAKPCVIELAQAIPARFVRTRRGTALTFTVPSNLLHPIPGIDNSVVRVTSKIDRKRRTVRRNGRKRTVGFMESVGGCRKGKRRVSVRFTDEAGARRSASTRVRCRR